MKLVKIFLSFMALMYVLSAHGANMCVKNDAVMVVLDPQINGTALANNATGKTWSTQFPYGVVSGIAGCSTVTATTSGAVATNQNSITTLSSGTYCYCKMLRPIVSPWAYARSSSSCATVCASYCSQYMGNTVTLRAGLFGNVGI